jgi:hypothetical protein
VGAIRRRITHLSLDASFAFASTLASAWKISRNIGCTKVPVDVSASADLRITEDALSDVVSLEFESPRDAHINVDAHR